VLNGDPQARYWGNVNLSFAYVEGESLLMGLKASLGGATFSAPVSWCSSHTLLLACLAAASAPLPTLALF